VEFLSFILQIVTSKPWALCQLYTKDYKTFLRPEAIPGNAGQSTVDPNSSLLYLNDPGVAWKCVKYNVALAPDVSLGDTWTPVTSQTTNIAVIDGVVSERYGNALISVENVSVAGDVMAFNQHLDSTGVDSFVTLSGDQFNGAQDFTIEVGFCISKYGATVPGTIACIFNMGHHKFSACNSLVFYVNRTDGSATLNYRGVAHTIFGAGVFEIGTYYELTISRTVGAFRFISVNRSKKIEGIGFVDLTPLEVEGTVLGQEQDTIFGGYDANQSLYGYISYFRFNRVDGKTSFRGKWAPNIRYLPNDIVTHGGGPGYYPTSRVEFTYADLTNKGGVDLGPAISKIFYDFAPINMVLQVNRLDYTGILEGFPLFAEIGPEKSEIHECVPYEYECAQTQGTQLPPKIVQFR
jgi:hypothetical protein